MMIFKSYETHKETRNDDICYRQYPVLCDNHRLRWLSIIDDCILSSTNNIPILCFLSLSFICTDDDDDEKKNIKMKTLNVISLQCQSNQIQFHFQNSSAEKILKSITTPSTVNRYHLFMILWFIIFPKIFFSGLFQIINDDEQF